MKRLSALALFALALGGADAVARQTQMGIDVTALGLFPVGDYEKVAGPAFGALGGLEIEAFPGLALTGRMGYVGHMARKNYERTLVPILGGVKLTSYSSSFYLAGEAGRARIRDVYNLDDNLGTDRDRYKTAWGAGIGSAADMLDLRLSLHVWDAEHWKETMTLGVSLAFLLWGY